MGEVNNVKGECNSVSFVGELHVRHDGEPLVSSVKSTSAAASSAGGSCMVSAFDDQLVGPSGA